MTDAERTIPVPVDLLEEIWHALESEYPEEWPILARLAALMGAAGLTPLTEEGQLWVEPPRTPAGWHMEIWDCPACGAHQSTWRDGESSMMCGACERKTVAV